MATKRVKKPLAKTMKGSDKSTKTSRVGTTTKVHLFSDWLKKKYDIEYDFEYTLLLKINNFIFPKTLSI